MRKYFLNFFFVFYVTTSTSSDYVKSDFDERTAILDTLDHLFPNITTSKQLVDKKRELSDCYDCNNKNCICPKCVKCSAMSVCTALIGHLVEEVYYPDNLDYKETCKVLDELGTRTQSVIFGNGRTFRDTPQCRDMVMQYLCLFYGSNNDMYTNHCQDELSGVDPATHVYVPRPPCRSFCVQGMPCMMKEWMDGSICYHIIIIIVIIMNHGNITISSSSLCSGALT